MGAMLVGMATGFAAMAFLVVWKIIFTVAVFLDTRRNKMNTLVWVIASFILDSWILLIYIPIRIKTALLKCTSCGTKAEKNAKFCANCGQELKRIDDGKIAVKFILSVCVIAVAFIVFLAIDSIIFG